MMSGQSDPHLPGENLPSPPTGALAGPIGFRYFGDFVFLGEIASGAMGVVFNARQVSLNRRVALKLIRAGQFATETDRRRFQREAEAAARLDHPNIVPVYEIGEHEGQPFLVMKLIDGDSLAEILTGGHPLTPGGTCPPDPRWFRSVERGSGGSMIRGRARSDGLPAIPYHAAGKLIAKLARAVAHAHERGVLHRDIKPANILIDSAGEPYLTDFGLAKMLETSNDLFRSGFASGIVGTPAFMSPEQASGQSGAVDVSSDVYSLGAVLYAILTGRPPVRADSIRDTLEQVRRVSPPLPRTINAEIPIDLETICLKCLQKDPAHRYSTARELAEDLERWLGGKPVQARRGSNLAGRWSWSRLPRRPMAIMLSAVLSVGGITLLLRHQSPAPSDPSRGFDEGHRRWQVVSAGRVQATGGGSYRLDALRQVTVVLPDNPATGDVIRISGQNRGGWRLELSTNQVILTDNLGADVGRAGHHWQPHADDRQWSGVSMSADGTKIVAVDFGLREHGGWVHVSTDGGQTWVQRGSQRYWNDCVISAEGGTIAAAALGKIYVSTNLGATWTSGPERRNWTRVASSSDGRHLVAADNGTNVSGGFIYTSDDRGVTWRARGERANWYFVASSADGRRLAAAPGEANIRGGTARGFVHTTSDGGGTWTAHLTDRERQWKGLDMSTNGATICAIEANEGRAPGGRLHFSRDFGETWSEVGPLAYWSRLRLSPDGRVWYAAQSDRPSSLPVIVISTNWGETWQTTSEPRYWSSIGRSGNLRRLVATAGYFERGLGCGVFISEPSTAPGSVARFEAAPGAAIELQYVGEAQFRVLRALGSCLIDGTRVELPGGSGGAIRGHDDETLQR